ncbi:MAG: GLPGLI family protein [Tetragenococcus halophilus]|nr:GLPGLI family protein [Tetragenococcus halophilus]MDN6342821.1 GLPGLI family protein [Lactococcus lactis]
MSKILFAFAVIISINQNMYSQELITDTSNYEVIYDLKYQRDSTDTDSQHEKMSLLIGDDYSLFESVNNQYNDSLLIALAENKENMSMKMLGSKMISQKKSSHFGFKILKNAKETLVQNSFNSNDFNYKDKDELDWKIMGKNQVINSYKCTLAKTRFAGRNYKAWFTNEIPISDGPYKFKGLPGLIIKIEDAQGHYVFELESFQKKKSSFEFDPQKGTEVSKKEYLESHNAYKKNFVSELRNSGIKVKGSQRRIQKKAQRLRNNEIEISF